MSRKEGVRLEVFARAKSGGAAGLAHRLRGKSSNRGADAAHRRAVLAAYRSGYAGFGPTPAAEQMAERDRLSVDHETLRRWLVAEGPWTGSRRR